MKRREPKRNRRIDASTPAEQPRCRPTMLDHHQRREPSDSQKQQEATARTEEMIGLTKYPRAEGQSEAGGMSARGDRSISATGGCRSLHDTGSPRGAELALAACRRGRALRLTRRIAGAAVVLVSRTAIELLAAVRRQVVHTVRGE